MSEKKQKIGAGHLKGMARSGFKELGQALPAFPAQGIQPVEEAGIAGNATPYEVAQEKGAYETLLGRYDSRTQPEPQKNKDLER